MKTVFLSCLLLLFWGSELWATTDFFPEKIFFQIRQTLSNGVPLALENRGKIRFHAALSPFYKERGFAPVWILGDGPTREAEALMEQLRSAAEEGLCGEDYRLLELEQLLRQYPSATAAGPIAKARILAALDLLLSDAFLLFADDFMTGRISPRQIHPGWRIKKNLLDPKKLLASAVGKGTVSDALVQLKPVCPGYRKLMEALREYRLIAAQGGWEPIPDGPVLRSGDQDPRIPQIQARLLASGDLRPPQPPPVDFYDVTLERGVIRFQRRHGLSMDGVLGPQTLTALNVTVDERIRQLEINLEYRRWLPQDLGTRYLLVNIPEMKLTVMENGIPVLWMPVIVGRRLRETPVFSARMTYLEFSPYWHVPPTILREDKIKKVKADHRWIEKNQFELVSSYSEENGGEILDPGSIDWQGVEPEDFPGLLRQQPGPWNPLGGVKFMFPNDHSVYLHDTNEPWLFSRSRRLFSSGCIRIQRSLDLVQYLLEGEGWDCEGMIQATKLFAPQTVRLPEPLPVYLFYHTAWVENDGSVHFRQDIYYKDMLVDFLLVERNQSLGRKR